MKKRLEMLLHGVIVITTLWAILFYFYGGPDILGSTGAGCFKYFTTDSNVLACAASGACLAFAGRKERPRPVRILRFTATVAVTITLLTVVFFLAPMAVLRGRGLAAVVPFFAGNVFVLHLSTPVLSIAAWLLSEREESPAKGELLWALVPVVLYAAVYGVMVVGLKLWRDWYGFTFGGRLWAVPIAAAVMLAFTLGVAYTEWKLHDRIAKRAEDGSRSPESKRHIGSMP